MLKFMFTFLNICFQMAINDDSIESNYEFIQKNVKNMEDLNKNISEEQPNEFHNGKFFLNLSNVFFEINSLETAISQHNKSPIQH